MIYDREFGKCVGPIRGSTFESIEVHLRLELNQVKSYSDVI